MKRVWNWLFDTKHPLRVAVVCLGIAGGNAYEAAYIDSSGGFMSAFSWVCAAGGVIGFVIFVVEAISDYTSRTDT